ncbi:MAG TPA: hypothetical protein V6C89_09325 [Drouetiella sp.]|jgi:hypothetical protein
MEEDVSRAIKQLESIAIKAMKSGYLDDAAKVMHIAEEIERVDKSGVSAEDAEPGDCCSGELAEAAEIESSPGESNGCADQSASGELVECAESLANGGRVGGLSQVATCEQSVDAGQNVVPLNRFRMKRDTAMGNIQAEFPRQ